MNRNSRDTARSVNDGEAGHDPVFKAVLIYENVAAGVRARWFLERLVRASGKTLEEQMWNFDVLGIRGSAERGGQRGTQGRRSSRLCITPAGVPGRGSGVARYVALAARRRESCALSAL